MEYQVVKHSEATLESMDIADDGAVSIRNTEYASPAALRKRDFVATFLLGSATEGLEPFLKSDGTFLLRFTRFGGIFIWSARSWEAVSIGSWSSLCPAQAFQLLQPVRQEQRSFPEGDPYNLLVHWYADEFGTL